MMEVQRKPMPLVSIVINNFNYARFLGRAIDSALAQTYRPCEVIVVDDGSTDNSRRVIANYGSRVIPVLKTNGGQASAMNAGFLAAAGEWIWFLDADDVLSAEAVERAMSAIRAAGSNVVKCHCRLSLVDQNEHPVGGLVPAADTRLPAGDLRGELQSRGNTVFPPTSGNVFSRAVLGQILPIPEDAFRLCGDAYVCTLAPLFGEVAAVDEPLAMYRVHGKNQFFRLGDGNVAAAVATHGEAFTAMKLMFERFARYFDSAVLQKAEALAAMTQLARHRLDSQPRVLAIPVRVTALTWCNTAIPLNSRLKWIAWAWATALVPRGLANRLIYRWVRRIAG